MRLAPTALHGNGGVCGTGTSEQVKAMFLTVSASSYVNRVTLCELGLRAKEQACLKLLF